MDRFSGCRTSETDPHRARAELRRADRRVPHLQAQAQVGITRSNQFPQVNGPPASLGQKIPAFGYAAFELQGVLSWNIDFWGQYRRATEAARANLLASEWNRKQVLSTIVANVATAYFQLRELDLELDIAKRTLASRQESLQLTKRSSAAAPPVCSTSARPSNSSKPPPKPFPIRSARSRSRKICSAPCSAKIRTTFRAACRSRSKPFPQTIPAGLPSRLLERRPDIRQAEQQLIAANAADRRRARPVLPQPAA